MEEKLFSIVRNLREYGYYKKSDANAAKILRKAFPGIGVPESLAMIAHFGGLYARISDLIDANRVEALALYGEQRLEELLESALEPSWLEQLAGLEQQPGLEPHRVRCAPHLLASMMGYFIVHWHLER
ncbi:hypothetical protein KKD52_01855 [Myxococcota bacterium]|nr:hypothetical protein [Myxococcota bacterium]